MLDTQYIECYNMLALLNILSEITKEDNGMDNNNVVRFLLTFFLGFIGSIIINYTSLKPNGYKSRTLAYFFLSIVTFGIYGLVASICNLFFDPSKPRNIGYTKD